MKKVKAKTLMVKILMVKILNEIEEFTHAHMG
jgi:hypothetical protein